MHTGGDLYNETRGRNQSVIEFGHPFSDIIEHIIIQRFERERFGLLKEYLACKCTRQQDFSVGVKKIVEGRNLTKFKNIVKNSVAVDESLKTFFEFFPGKEEIEPMDINRVHRRLTAERR